MAHHLLETRGQDNGHLRCQPRIGVLAHNRMAGRRYLGWGTGRQGQTGGQSVVNWRGKDLQLVWFTEISPWFDYEKVAMWMEGWNMMETYFGDGHGDCHGGTMEGPMIPTAWNSHQSSHGDPSDSHLQPELRRATCASRPLEDQPKQNQVLCGWHRRWVWSKCFVPVDPQNQHKTGHDSNPIVLNHPFCINRCEPLEP